MDSRFRNQHPSSRLVRREQKKAVRQTIIFIAMAIILLVVFVAVVMPNFLRFVGGLGGDQAGDPTDTLPPQIPVIAAPPQATSSATLPITGYGESSSQVVFLLNGSELERKTIGDDGTFSIELPLADGENKFSTYSIDSNNNESSVSREYVIVHDNQPPKLEISEPQPDQQIEQRKNQLTTIKGTTDPGVEVMVNGRRIFANAQGAFSTTYQLSEGDNKLTIEAIDQAGNKTTTELTVKFRL